MVHGFKVKECYSRFNFHVLDYFQWLRMRDSLSILGCIIKKIQLWGIISTSGNFRPYQIQTAFISLNCYVWLNHFRFLVCYYSKATTLDKTFGPAWLAYGHSFAADNEHDQAMAAYFTASQIMKGWVFNIVIHYHWLKKAKPKDSERLRGCR